MSLKDGFNSQREKVPPTTGITYYQADGQARNVCFAPPDGTRLFLSYAELISGAFNPGEKGNTITLTFRTHIVTLKGQNLLPLFDGLAVQSLQRIETVEERYASTEEGKTFVTQITVRNTSI